MWEIYTISFRCGSNSPIEFMLQFRGAALLTAGSHESAVKTWPFGVDLHKRAPCSVLHAPCFLFRAPCSVLCAPCFLLRIPCFLLRALCSVLCGLLEWIPKRKWGPRVAGAIAAGVLKYSARLGPPSGRCCKNNSNKKKKGF